MHNFRKKVLCIVNQSDEWFGRRKGSWPQRQAGAPPDSRLTEDTHPKITRTQEQRNTKNSARNRPRTANEPCKPVELHTTPASESRHLAAHTGLLSNADTGSHCIIDYKGNKRK